jgi:hypothetical protein
MYLITSQQRVAYLGSTDVDGDEPLILLLDC